MLKHCIAYFLYHGIYRFFKTDFVFEKYPAILLSLFIVFSPH